MSGVMYGRSGLLTGTVNPENLPPGDLRRNHQWFHKDNYSKVSLQLLDTLKTLNSHLRELVPWLFLVILSHHLDLAWFACCLLSPILMSRAGLTSFV